MRLQKFGLNCVENLVESISQLDRFSLIFCLSVSGLWSGILQIFQDETCASLLSEWLTLFPNGSLCQRELVVSKNTGIRLGQCK